MPLSIDYGFTAKFLRTLYTLEEPAGILRHKRRPLSMFKTRRGGNTWNAKYPGKIVGRTTDGYLHTTIRIDGCRLGAKIHNIIWCMRTGKWPTREVDHINGDRLDNSLGNHRLASRSQQSINKAKQSNNTSGVTGISRCDGGWLARIKPDGMSRIILYRGPSKQDAIAARHVAELEYFGEYRRKRGMA